MSMSDMWPVSEPPKKGDINDKPYKKITGDNLSDIYGGIPVTYSPLVPKGTIIFINKDLIDSYQPIGAEDDDFDNAGRAYSDILLDEVGRHYEKAKPKKKWYFLWLK